MIGYVGGRPGWLKDANARSLEFQGHADLTALMLADSPLALWKMDDTSGLPQDSSGNDRDMSEGTAPDPSATGIASVARSHDFSDGGFTRYHGSWMNVTAISIVCLANFDTVSGAYRDIVDRDGSGRVFQFRLNTDGALCAIPFISGSPQQINSTVALSTGTDYLLAWTHPGGGGASTLYINGVARGSQNLQNLDTATQDIRVGFGGNGNMDGRLANVAIYDTALSADRIAEYAAAAGF